MSLSFQQLWKSSASHAGIVEKGITAALGTDGAAHGGLSLFNEMKIFRSVMNLTWGVPLSEPAIMPAKTILSMATEKGQQCLGGQDGVDGFLKREQELISSALTEAAFIWQNTERFPTRSWRA